MRVVLVPIQSYDGPFGNLSAEATGQYYRAVTSQVADLIRKQGVFEEVVVSPYGIASRGEGSKREFTLCKWDQIEQGFNSAAFFKEQCSKSYFVFIRGGRWIENPSLKPCRLHSPRFLAETVPTSTFIDAATNHLFGKSAFPYAVVDPVASLNMRWVFLDSLEGCEQKSPESKCQKVYFLNGESSDELVAQMNSENARVMQLVTEKLCSEALSPSLGPQTSSLRTAITALSFPSDNGKLDISQTLKKEYGAEILQSDNDSQESDECRLAIKTWSPVQESRPRLPVETVLPGQVPEAVPSIKQPEAPSVMALVEPPKVAPKIFCCC